MILLDASIIIDGLRNKDMTLLNQLHAVGGAVCGVTRAEVLSGARGPEDRAKLVTMLDAFAQLRLPPDLWDEVGDVQAQLRRNGVTAPFADTLLVAAALAVDAEIWARDADFNRIQRVFPQLKLYSE